MYNIMFVLAVCIGSFTSTNGTTSDKLNCTLKRLQMNRLFIDCSGRNLRGIPPRIPLGTYELDISNNPLKTILNGSFRDLRYLKYLTMNNCQIKGLERYSFDGLSRLVFLDLSSNLLQEKYISEFVFSPLLSLKELLLEENNFYIDKKYPDRALSYLKKLNNLSIEAISKCALSHGFSNLSLLTSLKLISSRVHTYVFQNDTISVLCTQSLKYLTIQVTHGYIHLIDNGIFLRCKKLVGFKTDGGNKSDLKMLLASLYFLQGQNMEYISLATCSRIVRSRPISITVRDFEYLKRICVKSLDLDKNSIKFDSNFTAALMSLEHKNCLEEINLSENIFVYEWSPLIMFLNYFLDIKKIDIYHLSKFGYNSPNSKLPNFHDNVFTAMGNINRIRNESKITDTDTKVGLNISQAGVMITFDIYFPPRLEYVNASFLKTTSTYLPWIFIVHGGKMKTLDLAYADLSSCEGEIRGMTQLTNLNISGWGCSSLNPKLIQNLTALETLYATNSDLATGFSKIKFENFLKGLKHLSVVKLSDNELLDLHFKFFYDQHNSLRELYLDGNKFQNIPIDASKFLHLTLIDLSYNELITLTITEQKQLDKLWSKNQILEINLKGNKLQCTCENIGFLVWMNMTRVTFRNISTLLCMGNNQTSIYIDDVIRNIDGFYFQCISHFWLYFSVVTLSLLILGLVISALGYRYRYFIEYTILRIRRWLKKNQPILEEYEYDVFISYSSHDTNWVVNTLYPKLRENFNVCLYDKDFLPGVSIADNIMRAIDSSRKVMFIVTKHFLESSWGNYEMEMTRMHVFQNGRDNMVIILLKDEIPLDDMPKVLQNIWWKLVCLQWEVNTHPDAEDLFWTKLRDSLSY